MELTEDAQWCTIRTARAVLVTNSSDGSPRGIEFGADDCVDVANGSLRTCADRGSVRIADGDSRTHWSIDEVTCDPGGTLGAALGALRSVAGSWIQAPEL